MLQVGDFVLNRKTGCYGKVVGYGHQIVDGVYLPTLMVRVLEDSGLSHRGVVEDLSSAWMQAEEKQYSKAA